MVAKTQLDRIEGAILGNGREGLLTRTARIEEQLKTVVDVAKENNAAALEADTRAMEHIERISTEISSLVVTVATLSVSVTAHHKTEHLSDLMKKKSFWAGIIGAFVVLHLLSTYVPNAWDWAMIMLGIPKLVIPIG